MLSECNASDSNIDTLQNSWETIYWCVYQIVLAFTVALGMSLKDTFKISIELFW